MIVRSRCFSTQVISNLKDVKASINLIRDKCYVNGGWIGAASGKTFNVTNPANGNVITSVPDMTVADTEVAVKAAAKAFNAWQDTTAKERARILRRWYNILEANREIIAEVMTAESGKPLVESRGEVTYGNSFIEWFSEEARRIQGEIVQSPTPTKKIMVVKEPIGVAALITPWNFPHAMIARKAGAALASGCTCVIKPAEDTPLTALFLGLCAHEAGFPEGVINIITSDRGNASSIGKYLCESPLVAGISFTGSTAVGKLLYSQCASGVKRLGLELGGNAPFIVFDSANVDKATSGALASKFRNCGQTCVAANRFLVQDGIYDQFVESFVGHIKDIKMGEGTQPCVTTGPLINHAQFRKVSDIVQDALDKGAKALTGGKPASSLGELFYEPTLLVDVKENMRVYKEEVFGPVATIVRFKTEEEALRIANATERGLAAYFYTEDVSQMFRVSKHLEAGMIGINEGLISTAEAPFGGIKESGLGREGSHHGVEDYTYIKIQQVDGGFFERFGSLLREHSVLATEKEYQENLIVAEAAAKIIPHLSIGEGGTPEINENKTQETLSEEQTNDEINVDNDVTGSSVDSEQEDRDKAQYYAVGMNIDELYSEIIYEILHNVGCDVSYEVSQTALFSYLQEAFKMTNEKHNELLTATERKEPPELLLNVEVVEAKDLAPKDSNGLSDPFVTLYLMSNASLRYNTSVKPETLNPTWEEHFALPVSDQNSEDMLCLEVWDFDPAETLREKFGKILQVKGIRGARKLLKEIAITATMGQHKNELVGTAKIPLKSIPSSGMTMWYSLDKKSSRATRRGVVKLNLSFGSEKNSQVALQEHKHLLHLLLLHELESSQIAQYTWKGKFSVQGETLLTQHRIQSGLSQNDIALAKWTIYSSIHRDHPLNFSVFSHLLDAIVKPLQGSTFEQDDIKLFWEGAKKLLPSCFATVRKIRKKQANEKAAAKKLLEVLRIISKLSCLEPPEGTDLFPSSMYSWLTYKDEGPNWDIRGTLTDAVMKGARDWFNYILQNNKQPDDSEDESLLFMNKIIHLVRSDLQKAVELYDKMFQEVTNFPYAKTLYNLYQVEVSTLVEPNVITICKSLKRITYEWNCVTDDASNEPLSVGTKLFELYLSLQRFVILGRGLNPAESESYHIKNFHKWFYGGVAQWLDMAVFKALQRIDKAVELDNLTPVDETVKYSSSALDTLTIFHQIKIFWDQLNWPDVEGSYTFVAKIIDDICRCSVFYADKMDHKVEGMGDMQDSYEKRFEVTCEWCLAINNIDYVCQSLTPFTEKLDLESILEQLADIRDPMEAQRCRDTLRNVLENSIDTVKNKIIELLEIVARKMVPAMKKLLIEGAELLHQDSNSIDKVMRYLDSNLATLHEELNEDNFNRILDIIWDFLGNILTDLIQSNIERRRPPSFFANLRDTLELMVKSFQQSDEASQCSNLQRIEYLLKINGMETAQLIHQVHLERRIEQKSLKTSPFGELTVRLQLINQQLKIEVINARNLIAMDSNGLCDSFVRIYLLPEEKFTNVPKPKTQTHNKNQFPLYDETFVLNLTPEQLRITDGLVLFNVKDKDFLGMSNQFIGEAFVHFKDIPSTPGPITTLPQVRLLLNRPSDLSTDSIRALENRQGDKLAKEFVKKLKQKGNGSSG